MYINNYSPETRSSRRHRHNGIGDSEEKLCRCNCNDFNNGIIVNFNQLIAD